jgi:hypothetical protein
VDVRANGVALMSVFEAKRTSVDLNEGWRGIALPAKPFRSPVINA